jgi:hypothetical protein
MQEIKIDKKLTEISEIPTGYFFEYAETIYLRLNDSKDEHGNDIVKCRHISEMREAVFFTKDLVRPCKTVSIYYTLNDDIS